MKQTAIEYAGLNQREMQEGMILTRNSRDRIVKEGKTITVAPAWEFVA
ncbi:hypothetical protein FACS1894109_20730 [Spirochaetia bacterium]|nr:hypothetical protein FACS1894109_20730 [Spirochaetia bacterium]